jgi:predicted ester cyclase
MTPDALVRSWFEEVWNAGDENAIDRYFAQDGIAHGLPGPDGKPLTGPAAFKPFVKQFRTAFPNIHIEVLRTITEGPYICAHCRVTGTHSGPGFGPSPTNGPIDFSGMTIVRIENDKIHEGWNSFDFMSLFQQIRLLPKI